MAPSRFPSNGTDWSAWSLGDLEKRAVEYASDLSPQFKRALAAARRKYAAGAGRVPRRPTAWGGQVWGPIPGTRDAHLMWDGPGDGLMYYPRNPAEAGAAGLTVRHGAVSGTYQTLAQADRMARRFIAIGLDNEARDERSDAERAADAEDIVPPVTAFLDRLGLALERRDQEAGRGDGA